MSAVHNIEPWQFGFFSTKRHQKCSARSRLMIESNGAIAETHQAMKVEGHVADRANSVVSTR